MQIKIAISTLCLIGASSLAFAQQRQGPPAAPTAVKPVEADAKPVSYEITKSVTKHTATLHGVSIPYTATAGQIPLRNEAGEVECRMFYVSYTKGETEDESRPVTIAFNGGPGSATLWLHMGALGPKRAPMNDDGSLPKPPYTPVNNDESWLDFTDMVCVDAPAAGYSRVMKHELGTKFFGVREDIAAFTEFVKGWLKEHHRWRSPVFIAGESYGGIRGSGLCSSLFDSGVAVSGFVSISGTSNYLTLSNLRGNDATYTGFLPSMAACAWYHKKVSHEKYKDIGEFVTEVRKWTDNVYGPALSLGDSLTDAQRDQVATKLAFYLGLTKKYCLGSNLKVTEFAYFRELLRDEGLTIGRYDGRLIGKDETHVGQMSLGDPSDQAVNAPFITSINDYLERDLGIKTDMPYLTYGAVRPWKEPEGSYAETASDLSKLLLRNPHFRVLYCCGYYDLACPLNATHFTVNHMGLDSATRAHVSFKYYPAGHMMYIEKGSRKTFHDDVAAFEADTLK